MCGVALANEIKAVCRRLDGPGVAAVAAGREVGGERLDGGHKWQIHARNEEAREGLPFRALLLTC